MTSPDSRYRPGSVPDYSHRFHAGNIGDVWKHCVLAELLRRLSPGASLVYLESHAGEGRYALASTGEWSEGIGRLWSAYPSAQEDAVSRYLDLCQRLGAGSERPEVYPGSPTIAQALLPMSARLILHERDPVAFARLERELAGDDRMSLHNDDGLAGLAEEIGAAEAGADAVVVLIDPPYSQKDDWRTVAKALTAAALASQRACIALWYPVKSLTRPNAMRAELEAAGVSGTLVELITTPLEHKRSRLNGSGLFLIRPPEGLLGVLAAAAAEIGPRCATRDGTWSFRMLSWRGRNEEGGSRG